MTKEIILQYIKENVMALRSGKKLIHDTEKCEEIIKKMNSNDVTWLNNRYDEFFKKEIQPHANKINKK